MSKITADFAGEMNSCFALKGSGCQPQILLQQHADHLLGWSQMAIWKAFSVIIFLRNVTAHFQHDSFIILCQSTKLFCIFSCYLSRESDMTLMSVHFLLKK